MKSLKQLKRWTTRQRQKRRESENVNTTPAERPYDWKAAYQKLARHHNEHCTCMEFY